MPTKGPYQVRNAAGRLHTVQAFSTRGAVKLYVVEYPTTPGEVLEVKRRGSGPDAWEAFRVS
jgi:hypothetical protein